MALNRIKTLGTDIVFNPARVLGGGLFIDAEGNQPGGEQFVALVDGFGDLPAAVAQVDIALFGDSDIVVFTQIFHSDADAGFLEIHLRRDINGADYGEFFAQHQYGFKIIFCRFSDCHRQPFFGSCVFVRQNRLFPNQYNTKAADRK